MTMQRAISGQRDNDTPSPEGPGAHGVTSDSVTDLARTIRRVRRRWRRRQTKPVLPSPGHRRRRITRRLVRSPLLRVLVALVVAANVRDRYRELDARRAAWGESVQVAVMARSRPAGSLLRSTDIAMRNVPRVAVPRGTPAIVDDLVGRRVLTAIDVGEFITPTRLTRGPSSALRARTGEGRYAVTITMRDNRPRASVGDEVDVIDASGNTAATQAVVVQLDKESLTLSVQSADLRSLSAALAGPLLVAVRGEEAAAA